MVFRATLGLMVVCPFCPCLCRLAGNLVALFFSALVCIVLTHIWPDDFDWTKLQEIATIEHDVTAVLAESDKAELDQVCVCVRQGSDALVSAHA